MLYKTGETKKVSSLKEKSISLKSLTRKLQEQLIEIEKSLIDLRIQLPNVPYDIVPNGNSDKDNEEVFNSDLITESKVNYLPHWELGKKYDIPTIGISGSFGDGFEKLDKFTLGNNENLNWLKSHPSSSERINEIKKNAESWKSSKNILE